jgi:very-short-patch-repair endonuclease
MSLTSAAVASTSQSGSPDQGRRRGDLGQVLKDQHSVITRSQALACGLSYDAVRSRTRHGGRWQRLLPGVYLAVTGTPTTDQRETAALLYAGRGSVLSGAAALRRFGMRGMRSELVDVLIPARRRRQSTGFVTVHLTTRMPSEVCYQGPIQYVFAARAAADSARWLDKLEDVRAVVAGAVQARLCTVQQLGEELRSGPVRGSALLRQVLAEVADGVRSAREAELMDLIKRSRLPMPLYNARLYLGDELIAVADAWWRDAGVVAEVDSKEWHLSPEHWEQTMRRHARMTALGILVLHFSPRQLRLEPDQVVRAIAQALESRRGQSKLPVRTAPHAG